MRAYHIPINTPLICEENVKKSRFITLLTHTNSVDAARECIRQVKSAYPDATHHCSAFVAGAPWDSQVYGFSDDGEPSGTAGKPMLAQLQGYGVGEITAVVVRYYGGIQLGTGGLVKAYGQGVQKALKMLELQLKVPMQTFQLNVDYTLVNDITHLIGRFEGSIEHQAFTDSVIIDFSLPENQVDDFALHLTDLSRGKIVLPKKETKC